MNNEYLDSIKSPLSIEDRKLFKGHTYFEVDTSFCINSKLVMSTLQPSFVFKTSKNSIDKQYRLYGTLHFQINKTDFALQVYQSLYLLQMEDYKDYLFCTFTDSTTAEETYGGGRYIDLRIPKTGNSIMLDFNNAYNPYCAYSANFACPLVPESNDLKIKIKAGVKYNTKQKFKQ